MKTKLLALVLLGVGTMFAGPRIGVSVGIGPAYPYYAPAPAYYAPAPAYYAPAPVYSAPAPVVVNSGWVNGYWYNVGPHRYWRAGYWAGPRGHVVIRGRRR
ncbi:MAG TPA: hypothetical protein VG273_27200 [Bryobacteraceae bacterium]|jgi:hypothetical protein|nr:hypothetical protein [Bryobacteraceae bacterium]